jgi:tetratricopeptide (TPR) repeat protein
MKPTAIRIILPLILVAFFLGVSGIASDDRPEKELIYNPEDVYALDLAKELKRLELLLDKKPLVPTTYTLLVKKAQIQFAKERLQDAKKSLEQALKLKPKGKWARYFFAKTLLFIGEYEKATEALNNLLESYPRFANLYADLAFVAMADSKRALTLIDKAISLNGSEPYFYLIRALISAFGKKFQQGLDDLSKTIEMSYGSGARDSALPYALRSALFLGLGRHRDALRDAHCALALSKGKKILDYSLMPRNVISSASGSYEFLLWSIYYSERKLDHCERVLNSFPAKELDKGSLAIAKAMQLLRKQKSQEALALLNASESHRAKEFPQGFYWALGNVYCAQKKYDFALGMYDKLYAQKHYNIGLTICKARILACGPDKKYHDPALAIKMLETCCSWTDHKSPRLLLELAIAYGADGQFDKAKDSAKKALELLPSESNLREEFEDVAEKLKNKKAILFKEGFWQMPYFPF